jgi:hypothetical protein
VKQDLSKSEKVTYELCFQENCQFIYESCRKKLDMQNTENISRCISGSISQRHFERQELKSRNENIMPKMINGEH